MNYYNLTAGDIGKCDLSSLMVRKQDSSLNNSSHSKFMSEIEEQIEKENYSTSLGEEQHRDCSFCKNGFAGEAKTSCKKLMG